MYYAMIQDFGDFGFHYSAVTLADIVEWLVDQLGCRLTAEMLTKSSVVYVQSFGVMYAVTLKGNRLLARACR